MTLNLKLQRLQIRQKETTKPSMTKLQKNIKC